MNNTLNTCETITRASDTPLTYERLLCLVDSKPILDACCGSKMFWFDKNNPAVLYADIRKESKILVDGSHFEVNPDIQMDFKNMPFNDNTFKMVVFDPPQIDDLPDSSILAIKYGKLFSDWHIEISEGFKECMRVLEPYGILIFKWNEKRIKLSQLLQVIKIQPLFGHTSGKHGRTIWLAFMKGVSQ